MLWSDPYLANILPKDTSDSFQLFLEKTKTAQEARGYAFPSKDSFLTIDEIREVTKSCNVSNYAVVSLATRYRRNLEAIEYFSVNDGWGAIGKWDPKEFYRKTNSARFEITESIPGYEHWYAMIAGHFPEKCLEHVMGSSKYFSAMKIGAARPLELTDPQYIEVVKLCRHLNWPLLIHCSGDNANDFFTVVKIAKEAKSIPVIASHLGGIRQTGNRVNETNQKELTRRAKYLLENGIPDNFYINTAVRDLSLVARLLNEFPQLQHTLVVSADLPFLGNLTNYQKSLKMALGDMTENILQNSTQLMSYFGNTDNTALSNIF